ncbi:MAG: hypothetical protein K9M56_07505 [Victivallales bacterium]|nr:hypothetical protein [Victivallales bacterium]
MTQGKKSVITVSFLITGNSVGSGLLALPVCIGLIGIIPGMVVLILGCTFMTATGLVLAEIVNRKKEINFDLPSIYEAVLGKSFKWIAVAANLVVLYGLLVAYLACLTEIASTTLGLDFPLMPLIIFIIITSVNFLALDIIRKSNAVMVLILFISFIILVILTGYHDQYKNFTHFNWFLVPLSLPVLVNSFNFHNVIPITCRLLAFERKRTYTAILLGVFFSFILNLIWCLVVVGALTYSDKTHYNVIYSYVHNLPATVPLGELFKSSFFNFIGVIFAVVAVITSYWTVGAALTSFIGDLRKKVLKGEQYLIDLLFTFIPPLVIAIICPHIFISIQDIVGGIGIAILFGILPSFILFRKLQGLKRILPGIMIGFFSLVLALALLHKIGILNYFN